MSSLNSNELRAKKGLQEIEVERKHFNEICNDQPLDDDQTHIHSDSEDAVKNNSSDDICSLNSSNNNDELFFEDQFVGIINNKNDDECCSELVKSSEVFEETKYVISPEEVFGEVSLFLKK